MGQDLMQRRDHARHPSYNTAIKGSAQNLGTRYGVNQKTITKWREPAFVNDAPMGPTVPRSTVLSSEEEDIIVTFCQHTLLRLDDCLYALQATFLTLLDRLCIVPQTLRHQSLTEIACGKAAKNPTNGIQLSTARNAEKSA
jgi:hypothetical protein